MANDKKAGLRFVQRQFEAAAAIHDLRYICFELVDCEWSEMGKGRKGEEDRGGIALAFGTNRKLSPAEHETVSKAAKYIKENPGAHGKTIAAAIQVSHEHFRRSIVPALKESYGAENKDGYHIASPV